MEEARSTRLTRKSPVVVAVGTLFSCLMVALGYVVIAPHVAVLFSLGFFGGLLLWLIRPMNAGFRRIKAPYIASLVAYAIHRTDEEVSGFVSAVEEATGHQTAAVDAPVSIALGVFSLIWFLAPLLIRRGHAIGYYAAWTVFASLGVVEIGHFIFPLLTPEPYGYFPGMITVPLVIAAGLWGMWRLWPRTGSDEAAGSEREATRTAVP